MLGVGFWHWLHSALALVWTYVASGSSLSPVALSTQVPSPGQRPGVPGKTKSSRRMSSGRSPPSPTDSLRSAARHLRMSVPLTQFSAHPVCTENLNPNVLMMKSAQDSVRTYDAGSLNRPRNRRIFVQRSMRSDAVVIIGVRFQNPAQMLLAEDNEVIQTLTPDRSDQPFGKAILPR